MRRVVVVMYHELGLALVASKVPGKDATTIK
jgi:hypothetical protein